MALAALALLLVLPEEADSGDLALLSQGNSAAPNIMIIMDSSGSMSDQTQADIDAGCGTCDSKRQIAEDAVIALVQAVNPPDGSGGYTQNARFGLAKFRPNGAELLVAIGDNNTQAVINAAGSVTQTSVGTPVGGAALDVGRYLAGDTGWGTLPKWGTLTGETAQASPFDLSCRETFVIYITDGLPNKDQIVRANFAASVGDSDNDDGVGEGSTEDGSLAVSDAGIQWGDDITWAMSRRDFAPTLPGMQNVVTHMIGFDIDSPILSRMAANGGGNYYTANNASQLATALAGAAQSVFEGIGSFATAVVPASRTIFGAAFYNAFFEPRSGEPVWAGHLEAYRLAPDGTIEDKDGNPAVDAASGVLYEPHKPFWDAGEKLASDTMRDLYTTVGGVQVDLDTSNVSDTELGLVAADIPFYPNAASSGVDTISELTTAVIDYVHGKDAFDEDNDSDYTELRDIVLGDIFHSTPRAVAAPSTILQNEPGYDSFLTAYVHRDRVIYAGANDGLLHAFDAGEYHSGDDASTTEVENGYYDPGLGNERFGYVPGLLLDQIKMIPRNVPRTFYYVDGSPVAAEVWLGDGSGTDTTKSADEWATVLITGFREGGPGYLALDVTDPDAMAADAHGPYPLLLWEFDHPKLGESWSDVVITRVKLRGVTGTGDKCGADDGEGDCREQWVAIFGGGYEESANPNSLTWVGNPADPSWTDRGRAIFMVALDTGQVLASVEYDSTGVNGPSEMFYALPSRPSVLDLDFDGFADVVYIGDLGGQLWKWDIHDLGEDTGGDARVDNWPAGVFFMSPPAIVAGPSVHFRSIFSPPAASFVRGKLTLSFGTGERNALEYEGDASYDENNRFYVIRDPHPMGSNAFATTWTETHLTNITSVDTDSDPSDLGFFVVAEDGEKFVGEPVVFARYVIAASYMPTVTACGVEGEAFLYAFRVRDGKGLLQGPTLTPAQKRRSTVGGGLPSSPQISLAPDPNDDEIYIKTSTGEVLTVDPPDRGDGGGQVIYWTQKF